MIPEFHIVIPVIGNRAAVGLVFQTHLLIVAFIMGIAVVGPVAEILGHRQGDARWNRLARSCASTITHFFSFGATWAVFGLVLLFGLYPTLFGRLTSIFFWPLVVVGGIWFIMTVTAYLHYYTWRRLQDRRGLHMAIGLTFAGSAIIFITLISELSSYQLTPSDPSQLVTAALNPTWITEVVHRHIGNLSYAGILLAAYAGLRVLFWRGNQENRAYYDWLGHLGVMLGVGLALLQPIVGWFYARQIHFGSPGAYDRMMINENAWMFLVQTFFLGSVLFFGNLYLVMSIRRGNPGRKTSAWLRISIWLLALVVLLAIIPKELPLGQMMPWKYLALAGLVAISFANLLVYVGARREFVWGEAGWGSQVSLVLMGLTIACLIVTMGIIRESARGTDLIYDQLPADQSQQLVQP